MTRSEIGVLYEIVLSIHSMGDVVKLDLRMSKRLVLLLAQVIEIGLKYGKQPEEALNFFPEESVRELQDLVAESLQNTKLHELHSRLGSLQPK